MSPRLSWTVVPLRPRHPFTIARGTRAVVPTVIVRLEYEGVTGLGEASPLARYGESTGTVAAFLSALPKDLPEGLDDPDALLDRIAAAGPGNAAARAALDIAVHDWVGKRRGIAAWQHLGLRAGPLPRSSMTIGICPPEEAGRRAAAAAGFAALKVKMGVEGDRDLFLAVRTATEAPIRVDANEGWKSREEALERLLWLRDRGVELVEQPIPAGRPEDVRWLRERSGVRLFADEDLTGRDSLDRIAGSYDGVNVKLMKCGGLREGLRLIRAAKELGMDIMTGCMIETSVGISAAAQLASLADAADLDGALLIDNDPFRGAVAADGTIRLTGAPGIGVGERER